jgi:ABC-type Fe3+/spermidine/putrescine transport system ATPase subunit
MDNAMDGTVRDTVYTGSDTQYFVELGPEMVVTVRVPNDRPPGTAVVVTRGDRVSVRWDGEGTTVLVA